MDVRRSHPCGPNGAMDCTIVRHRHEWKLRSAADGAACGDPRPEAASLMPSRR
jgi:hypothetical protein